MTYEVVIKINPKDEPRKRAREIAEGIEYAVALLQSEYGWAAVDIEQLGERIIDCAHVNEARR